MTQNMIVDDTQQFFPHRRLQRDKSSKTFYDRNLQNFVISQAVLKIKKTFLF